MLTRGSPAAAAAAAVAGGGRRPAKSAAVPTATGKRTHLADFQRGRRTAEPARFDRSIRDRLLWLWNGTRQQAPKFPDIFGWLYPRARRRRSILRLPHQRDRRAASMECAKEVKILLPCCSHETRNAKLHSARGAVERFLFSSRTIQYTLLNCCV